MLDNYFCAPKTLRRLRAGPSGPYINGFADALERDGYAHASVVRYLRAAAHLGCFVGSAWADVDGDTLEAFGRHFARCRCPGSNAGVTGCCLHCVMTAPARCVAALCHDAVARRRRSVFICAVSSRRSAQLDRSTTAT